MKIGGIGSWSKSRDHPSFGDDMSMRLTRRSNQMIENVDLSTNRPAGDGIGIHHQVFKARSRSEDMLYIVLMLQTDSDRKYKSFNLSLNH